MALFIVSAAKPTLTRSRKLTKYSTITKGMMRHISLRDTRVARSDFIGLLQRGHSMGNAAAVVPVVRLVVLDACRRAQGSSVLVPASDEDGAEVVHIGQRRAGDDGVA